jgi:hypothetical protein
VSVDEVPQAVLDYHAAQHKAVDEWVYCESCQKDRATCTKKHRYASRVAAQEATDLYHVGRKWAKPWLRFYPCNWCSGFHLTRKMDQRTARLIATRMRAWLQAEAAAGRRISQRLS